MGIEAAVFAGISLIGTGISAYGQYTAGQEQKKAYQYNADLDRQRAEQTRNAQALNDFRKQKEITAAIGAQAAGYAAGGVITTTGSPIDVMTDSLANADLEMRISDYNSEIAASQLESEASMEEEAGKYALEEGTVGAISTVAKGVGDAGYKFIGSSSGKKKIGDS